jgi:hypothetical protein
MTSINLGWLPLTLTYTDCSMPEQTNVTPFQAALTVVNQ